MKTVLLAAIAAISCIPMLAQVRPSAEEIIARVAQTAVQLAEWDLEGTISPGGGFRSVGTGATLGRLELGDTLSISDGEVMWPYSPLDEVLEYFVFEFKMATGQSRGAKFLREERLGTAEAWVVETNSQPTQTWWVRQEQFRVLQTERRGETASCRWIKVNAPNRRLAVPLHSAFWCEAD